MQVTKEEFLENLIRTETKGTETRCYFNDKRINSKYIEICQRYAKIETLTWEMIHSECVMLIVEALADKDYIHISEDETGDDISYLLIIMDRRINDSINKYWTFAYRDRSQGKDEMVSPDMELSLDEVLYTNEYGQEVTRTDFLSEKDNMFYVEKEKSDNEIDKALQNIYEKAKLTDREIEILEALYRTQDNFNNREIYTKADAARILGIKPGTVRATFHKIKKKVQKAYDYNIEPNTQKSKKERQRKEKILVNFMRNIEYEKDVIDFINKHIDTSFMYDILYSNDIDTELRQHFIKYRNSKKHICSVTMREFCDQFKMVTRDYISKIDYNDYMWNLQGLHKLFMALSKREFV